MKWEEWCIAFITAVFIWACLLTPPAIGGTTGEISLMSSGDVSQFYSKMANYSDVWDKSMSWQRTSIGNLETRNRLTIWNDFWICRAYYPLKWLYMECEYELDFATEIDRAIVYIGWAQPVYDWWTADIYLGCYELTEWSFAVGMDSKMKYDLFIFVLSNKTELHYPISKVDKPEICMDSGIEIHLLKWVNLIYANSWRLRNMEIEQTNRCSLKFEF